MAEDFLTENDVEVFTENLNFNDLGDRISCQESMLDLKLGQTGISCLKQLQFHKFLMVFFFIPQEQLRRLVIQRNIQPIRNAYGG